MKKTESNNSEINRIKFIADLFYDYMYNNTGNELYLSKDQIVDPKYMSASIKSWREYMSDISSRINNLNPELYSGFLQDFEDKTGVGFQSVTQGYDRIVQEIISRKKISNKYEYYLIKSYEDSETNEEKLNVIRNILEKYQIK